MFTSVLNERVSLCSLFTKSKDLERLNLMFCKSVLGVKTSTCNAAIYGELGRLPLYINRYVSIIKYWLKLISTDNIMLKTRYDMSLKDTRNGRKIGHQTLKFYCRNTDFPIYGKIKVFIIIKCL